MRNPSAASFIFLPAGTIRCSIRVLLRVKKGIDDARLVVEANGGTVNYFTVPPWPRPGMCIVFFTQFIGYKFQRAQEKLTEAERAELKDFACKCEILQLSRSFHCPLYPIISVYCSA